MYVNNFPDDKDHKFNKNVTIIRTNKNYKNYENGCNNYNMMDMMHIY